MAIGRNNVTEPLASTVPSPSPATSQNWSRTFGCHQYCKLNIFTLLLWNFLVSCAFTYIILLPVDNYLNLRKFTAHFTLRSYGVLGIVQMLYPIVVYWLMFAMADTKSSFQVSSSFGVAFFFFA